MNIDNIKMLLILTQLTLAVTTDVRCYKVKNEANFIFAAAGILYHAYLGSQTEIIFSLLGLITPFVILMPLYILNMLGAGDIKLLCSIGALIGMRNVLLSIAFSFLFGSVVALAIMLANKNFISRFKNLYIYLKSCLLNMSILPYYQLNMNNDGKMHFTIPIALGTIAVTLF